MIYFNCTVTKADDEKTNIQAAIEVFENWVEKNTSSSTSLMKSSASVKDDKGKPETVPDLGFTAELETLK